MKQLENFIIETQTKLIIQQGQIELVMSLLAKKVGKEEFIRHLEFAVSSPGFGKEAKCAAAEILRQEYLWPQEHIDGQKQ